MGRSLEQKLQAFFETMRVKDGGATRIYSSDIRVYLQYSTDDGQYHKKYKINELEFTHATGWKSSTIKGDTLEEVLDQYLGITPSTKSYTQEYNVEEHIEFQKRFEYPQGSMKIIKPEDYLNDEELL